MTGGAAIDERLLDQASRWHRALADDDADWDGYIAWLEADPRHRRAFDRVALTERLIDEHRDRLLAILSDDDGMAPPSPPPRSPDEPAPARLDDG